jgi:hypothetical protein
MKQTLKEMIEEEKRREKEREDLENVWEFVMSLWYDIDSAGDR